MLPGLSASQLATVRIWYLVQHSLSAFRRLEQYFGSIEDAAHHAQLGRWQDAGLHASHLQRLAEFKTTTGQQQFERCLDHLLSSSDFILLPEDADYPQQLQPYADKPPILFGQGQAQTLNLPQIAIVGSRKPSPHGRQVAYDFAYYLSEQGFYITSGLAEGIDEAAHRGALCQHRTIAVVGSGLDQTYPRQNRELQQQIVQSAGAVLSEFLPGTKPLPHHFPRRNRIVSALSLGVVVAEAKLKSGSLITAQAAADQGKIIFAIPGHIYSEHHRGCHQLIREGAILVDHPEQILEDLALPTHWQMQQQQTQAQSTVPEIPAHLHILYQQLDWVGQDIDSLAIKMGVEIATLTSQLMELELLGLCQQQAGRYLHCRIAQ